MSSPETKSRVNNRQDCSHDEEMVGGPQPMRNCKPSKKTPNSVDQFWQLHQAEYEARGKRSTDHVERVHRHNAAHPELKDELNRRRSITEVTAVRVRRGVNLYRVCSACLKKNRRTVKRKVLKYRYQGRRNRQRKIKDKKYRSNRCERDIYKNKKSRSINRGTKRGTVNEDSMSAGESISLNEHKSGSDVGSLKNPSTTEPSVSSYNSFPSMDHEPMVF